jgi:hypothetical protein
MHVLSQDEDIGVQLSFCWFRLLLQVHTNLHAAFKCDALKLAMIKNEHLAQRLFDVRASMQLLLCPWQCALNLYIFHRSTLKCQSLCTMTK